MNTSKHTNKLILLSFFSLTFFLQGCSIGGKFLTEAGSSTSIKKNEVIIVGTIELKPKLDKGEQELDQKGVWDVMGFGEKNKNRSMITFNSKPAKSDYKYVINPELGKLFYFKVPKDLKYIVDGEILTVFSRFGSEKILLPTGFKINIKSSDKAIYIGRIRYYRDDFNSITRVSLKDEYKKARRLFKKKFGGKYRLRKSLAIKIK